MFAGLPRERGANIRCAGCGDRVLGAELWLVVQLVDHVAISAKRVAGVMAELARRVDDRATLVQQQRGEAVT